MRIDRARARFGVDGSREEEALVWVALLRFKNKYDPPVSDIKGHRYHPIPERHTARAVAKYRYTRVPE